MVRHYYRYDDMGALAPKFPGSFDNAHRQPHNTQKNLPASVKVEAKEEEKRTEKTEGKHENSKKAGFGLPFNMPQLPLANFFDRESGFDDLLLIFLIAMLLRSEERDVPLILALGYIFINKDEDT